jgi:hypothetical protein
MLSLSNKDTSVDLFSFLSTGEKIPQIPQIKNRTDKAMSCVAVLLKTKYRMKYRKYRNPPLEE